MSIYAIQSILETNFEESSELILEHVNFKNIFSIVIASVLFFLSLKLALKSNGKIARSKKTIMVAIAISIALIPVLYRKNWRTLNSYEPFLFITAIANYSSEMTYAKEVKNFRANLSFEGLSPDGSDAAKKVYVILIGESGNRNHFSIYGYARETTPLLASISEKLFIFTDAISREAYTIPSLRDAFFFEKDRNSSKNELTSARSLINLFNAAGFETYWYSNQAASSDRLTGAAVLAMDAKHRKFLNMAADEERTVSTDEIIVKELQSLLKDPVPKKAIFLHTMGSHRSYKMRYPKKAAYFQDPETVPQNQWRTSATIKYVNEYDNSIRFVDYVIYECIKSLQAEEGENFLLYFSDHGQEVYGNMSRHGQNSNTPTPDMYEIPLILWVSDEYKKYNQHLVNNIKNSLDKPFSLHYLTSTVSELAGLTGHDAFNAKNSIVNSEYAPPARMIGAKGKYIPYSLFFSGKNF